MARTNYKQPEPIFLGPIHRNCGYCGNTFHCTMIELLAHVHKCEIECIRIHYGEDKKS